MRANALRLQKAEGKSRITANRQTSFAVNHPFIGDCFRRQAVFIASRFSGTGKLDIVKKL